MVGWGRHFRARRWHYFGQYGRAVSSCWKWWPGGIYVVRTIPGGKACKVCRRELRRERREADRD